MQIRESVQKFAEAMELILRENDYKGGWEQEDLDYLFDRLTEEKRELRCLFRYNTWMTELVLQKGISKNMILKEAVDVANFCMMIADNCGCLKEKDKEEK